MGKFVKYLFFLVFCSGVWVHGQSLDAGGATNAIIFRIETDKPLQTIRNFGASTGFCGDHRGSGLPQDVRERMAELVFSKDMNGDGSPKGIGLSCFRFEIGAGTAYVKSGIIYRHRRTECFLMPDGSYDWSKSAGITYWMREAKKYGVETFIGYANSPPVYWTKSGDGYKYDNSRASNLREDRYDDFAVFLAEVAKHFEDEGMGFHYVCPVNEPQHSWSGKPDEAKQEGSFWTNEEISKIAREMNSAFAQRAVRAKILVPEAGSIDHLSGGRGLTSDQIADFWDSERSNYIGNLEYLAPAAAGHSYWTANDDRQIVESRQALAGSISNAKSPIEFWQTEFSLLSNGFLRERPNMHEMDGALYVAKVIHNDLAVANACTWQYWETFGHGSPQYGRLHRFTLVATARPDVIRPTKNLWILGHYSRFIRPGMKRLNVTRSDGLGPVEACQKEMVSAYTDEKAGRIVVVAINYRDDASVIRLAPVGETEPHSRAMIPYVTTGIEDENMRRYGQVNMPDAIKLPPRSIATLVTADK